MYERIRALREDRDLSQKQLSQALHCSQQVYSMSAALPCYTKRTSMRPLLVVAHRRLAWSS